MASLFQPDLPAGFRYEEGFLAPDEEGSLLGHIATVPFAAFEMRGVVARRRVAFFGHAYDTSRLAVPMPAFLEPVRQRAAAWADVDPAAFAMALINEYPPGAPIGWHRDAPPYDIVVGLSLASACRLRLRPYLSPRDVTPGLRRAATHELTLAPRSIYLLGGPARSEFEHGIPPVDALRYSITFRTLRSSARR
jgi:alkylated DNA repair dioxygenase AlkB